MYDNGTAITTTPYKVAGGNFTAYAALTYQPAYAKSGSLYDSFGWSVEDTRGGLLKGVLTTINVAFTNHAPVASYVFKTTQEL